MTQCIEKLVGNIKLTQYNLFLSNVEDMDELEYWEDRLDKFKEPYAITYCLKDGKISYNLYCNINRTGSAFKL